jgi:hypothetical protein
MPNPIGSANGTRRERGYTAATQRQHRGKTAATLRESLENPGQAARRSKGDRNENMESPLGEVSDVSHKRLPERSG